MTILALRGWARSGLVGRADRERLRLRLRLRLGLRLSRVPLLGPLLRERERDRERDREASRGVTERAMSSSAAGGVGERPREGLRLSDMIVGVLAPVESRCPSGRWLMWASRAGCGGVL
jgi:hypothetical protein